MVFRHKAPVTGVGGLVAVVAHHPVVVHIEGIGVGLFTVDVDAVFLDFQFVALIGDDAAFVDGQVVLGQLDGGAFGRNPYRAVVVAVPFSVKVQRIHLSREFSRFNDNITDEFLVARKGLVHLFGERKMIDRCQPALGIPAVQSHFNQILFPAQTVGHQCLVLFADAQFTEHIIGDIRPRSLYKVVELHFCRVLDGLAVDVYLSFLDLQRIAGQAYATFYIVFTTVNGAYDNVTVHSRIGTDKITSGIVVQVVDSTLLLACQAVHIHLVGIHAFSFFVSKGIEVCLLEVGGYRVACREVEHHNIVQFHFAEARHTFVFPLRPFDVRLGVEYR